MRVGLSTKVDDQIFDQICEVVRALGGTVKDIEWDFGPSIQTTTYAISLTQGQLTAQEDTEGGFFIEGEDELVSFLIQQLPPNLLFQPKPVGAAEIKD